MSSMPVSQLDTATTVASTGTKEARFGIEGRSVRAAPAVVKPRMRDEVETALALTLVTD